MGKIYILAAAALSMISCIGVQNRVVRAEETAYDFAMVLEHKTKLEASMDAECNFDRDCEKTHYSTWSNSENLLDRLAASLNGYKVLITALNPSKKSIRVWYNTRNTSYSKREEVDGQVVVPLEQFSFSWLYHDPDEEFDSPTLSAGGSDFEKALRFNDHTRFIPNQEVEIILDAPEDFDGVMVSNIKYGYTMDGGKSSTGTTFYDCTGAREYEEGMECRATYDANKSMHYVPVWATIEEPREEEEEDDDDTDAVDEEGNSHGNTEGSAGVPELGKQPDVDRDTPLAVPNTDASGGENVKTNTDANTSAITDDNADAISDAGYSMPIPAAPNTGIPGVVSIL